MTVPFWSLFVATFLPFIWVAMAAVYRKRQFGSADNRHPRLQQAQLEGSGARAHGASENAFEALVVYVPAVVVAHLAGADPTWSARLSIAWLALRFVHGVAYVADVDKLRSVVFVLAHGCVIGLFVLSAMPHGA